MKIGFIILCRYSSTRLPGKILKEIAGKPVLQYIIDSLLEITTKENIVVATSNENSDQPIVNYCDQNNIQVFRGDLSNVAKRFLDCAKEYKFDFATRINGDNIFVDTQTITQIMGIVQSNKYDFVSNVKNRTFPKGISVEVVRTTHYEKQYQKFSSQSDFEHVTIYLYEHDQNENYYYFYNTKCKKAAGIQFAIDTKEDFLLAEKIIKTLGRQKNFSLTEIYITYKNILAHE